MTARSLVVLASSLSLLLAACSGGGGGGGNPAPGGGLTPVVPASTSGDMVAYQASRGWNYQGNAFGSNAVTVSVYADPPTSNGVTPLVMFARPGTFPDAFAGTKMAGIAAQNGGGGYTVPAYVLLNNDGTTYAQGALSGPPTLVTSTLTQGQTFSPYPGVAATVTGVGSVPGANACPSQSTGATVQYTYVGQTYNVSYVPGCGITQYRGNHGEVLTLVSIGNYPQLGSQSIRRMESLTVFDTIKSLAAILLSRSKWHPVN